MPRPDSALRFARLPVSHRLRTPLRAIVTAVALAAAAGPVAALGLGPAEVTSYLGQPLQMRVPLTFDDLSDGSTQCPRIVPVPSPDVPTLAMGRIDIERSVTQSYVRITTSLPVEEPALRVVLEVGCTQRVRREFTVLLDPPAAMALSAPPAAPRIEFGTPQVLGTRGQPLFINVPIKGELAASLTPACVRPGRADGTESPRPLSDARVTLVDQGGGQRLLRIQTPDVVNDPRVRAVVEVGCDQPVRHEFVVVLEAPRLASTPAVEGEADVAPVRVAPRPAQRPAKPVQAARPAPTAATPPPAAAPETKAKPGAPAVEPTPVAGAAPAPAPRVDRLVLAAPEDQPRPAAMVDDTKKESAPEMSAEERAQVLKRLETLAVEVKTLRAELDATAKRNQELSEKARGASYAWAIAAGSTLLLGVAMLIGWRQRPRVQDAAAVADADAAGPMTRILGKPSESTVARPRATPAAAAAAPSMTEGAGPNTVAAIMAAHKAGHGQGPNYGDDDPTNMVVTEFRDTSQAINELYAPYVGRGAPVVTVKAPVTSEPVSFDLANERTTVLAPPTKTEIAVDIDLSPSDTQIARDLQREYERIAQPEADASKKDPAQNESELPTRFDTVPMTTRLALDLDLDISTIVRQDPPKKSG